MQGCWEEQRCCPFGQFLFVWTHSQPILEHLTREGSDPVGQALRAFPHFVALMLPATSAQECAHIHCSRHSLQGYFTIFLFCFNNPSSITFSQTALSGSFAQGAPPALAPAHPSAQSPPGALVSCKTRASRESKRCPAHSRAQDAAICPAGHRSHRSHADGCRITATTVAKHPYSHNGPSPAKASATTSVSILPNAGHGRANKSPPV